MPSLYEFDKKYNDLFERMEDIILENPDIDIEEIEKELGINEEERENKLKAYCQRIKLWESEIKLGKEEKKRIDSLIKSKTNSIEKLKNNIKSSMELRNEEEINLNTFKLTLRNSTSVNSENLEKLVKENGIAEVNLTFSENLKDNVELLKELVEKGIISTKKIEFTVSKTELGKLLEIENSKDNPRNIFEARVDKNKSVNIK